MCILDSFLSAIIKHSKERNLGEEGVYFNLQAWVIVHHCQKSEAAGHPHSEEHRENEWIHPCVQLTFSCFYSAWDLNLRNGAANSGHTLIIVISHWHILSSPELNNLSSRLLSQVLDSVKVTKGNISERITINAL